MEVAQQEQVGNPAPFMMSHWTVLSNKHLKLPSLKKKSDPYISSIKSKSWDFPGGPVVKNPFCNAGDDSGLIPGRGTKIAYAAEQLSPRATTKTW